MPGQSSNGPHGIIAARRTIVPIVATFAFPNIEPIGTACIIYAEGKKAIALTAAHNFDAIARLDRPYETYHPTTPQEFRPVYRNIVFNNLTPRVVYQFDERGTTCTPRISQAYTVLPLDIAVLILRIPDTIPGDPVFSEKLPIDSSPPTAGSPIKVIGYWNMSADPIEVGPSTANTTRLTISMAQRNGNITGAFPSGLRNKRWPCFQCSTAFDSGMSGAPILDTSGEQHVVGIASSDSSLTSSFVASGADAVASMLWPAMTIKLGNENLGGMNGPTLLDLAREGLIVDRGMPHQHIQLFPGTAQDEIFMNWV